MRKILSPKQSRQLAEWQAQYPGLLAEEVFPDRFGLTAEGRSHDGLEFNPAPQPPAWFTDLSPAQREAWEALKAAVSERTAAIFMTNPEDTGLYNPRIDEYVEAVHAVGGLCFTDQANLNGIIGKARARDSRSSGA